MTDLHLDVIEADFESIFGLQCKRNRWSIHVTWCVEIDKINIITEYIKYDHIYIPLSLDKCFVVNEGFIVDKRPSQLLDSPNIVTMDLYISGKSFNLLDMDVYRDIKMGIKKLD